MKGSMTVWKSGTGIGVTLSFLFELRCRLHIAAVFGLVGRFYQADLLATAGEFGS